MPRPPAANLTSIFQTSFDNGFAGFVYEGDSIAAPGVPGQSETAKYTLIDDPKMGKVFKAELYGMSKIEGGVARPFVGVDLGHIEGNFGSRFKVKVSNLQEGITIGRESNWQRTFTLWSPFDEGANAWHNCLSVELYTEKGNYMIMTRVTDPQGNHTILKRVAKAPYFDLDKWYEIQVDVDVNAQMVYTYQDGKLVNTGRYTAGTRWIEYAHWGMYEKGLSQGVLYHDDLEIYTWK